ncbi:MAG: MBL fold metallo-hydrolase [Dissulfurispiraceae bacterium]|jgi:metallo-beta-lactamase family protein|nr:MBL fold metallo-hydrolase [Dissulfurispiraceae bacterium]
MKIRFLGAAKTVTGSCFHLLINNMQMLVDCGMRQGEDAKNSKESEFDFDPAEIDCLFLTHAHIDHSGMIPRLVKLGFKGDILLTEATADLAEIMLYDSANIQEKDAQWATTKALRSGIDTEIKPAYTAMDVEKTLQFFKPIPYNKITNLGNGVKFRLLDAGHILGSASLELWYQDSAEEKKMVFSGDIGKKSSPVIKDPQTSSDADYIVIESTYGNRQHRSMKESIDELVDAVKTTFNRGGNVIIPSFAVGRTQDLLYIFNQLAKEDRLQKLDVYIDSPLAEKATNIYLSHPELYDDETRRLIKTQTSKGIRIHFTHSTQESMALNRIRSGIIIIAGSGMCEGGRVRHHLKHNLWRRECALLFVGFQAKGTLGRRIVDGSKSVKIFGEDIAVKASIHTIGGFSAHADQKELLEWLSSYADHPEIFVVHGEGSTAMDFAALITEKYGFNAVAPSTGDEFEI